MNTDRLAAYLIHRAADWIEAVRPIDNKTTRARLDGAGDAANALGYGMSGWSVTLMAVDWVRNNPRPVGTYAFHSPRKAWEAEGRAAVGAALDAEKH
jgi:hypothetical protein